MDFRRHSLSPERCNNRHRTSVFTILVRPVIAFVRWERSNKRLPFSYTTPLLLLIVSSKVWGMRTPVLQNTIKRASVMEFYCKVGMYQKKTSSPLLPCISSKQALISCSSVVSDYWWDQVQSVGLCTPTTALYSSFRMIFILNDDDKASGDHFDDDNFSIRPTTTILCFITR